MRVPNRHVSQLKFKNFTQKNCLSLKKCELKFFFFNEKYTPYNFLCAMTCCIEKISLPDKRGKTSKQKHIYKRRRGQLVYSFEANDNKIEKNA